MVAAVDSHAADLGQGRTTSPPICFIQSLITIVVVVLSLELERKSRQVFGGGCGGIRRARSEVEEWDKTML